MPPNTRFVTAVQVLASLAQAEGFKTSEELGEMIGAHPIVIRRIIARLSYAGIIITRRGFRHGSQMLRPPDLITLGEIYRVLGLRSPLFKGTARRTAIDRVNAQLAKIHSESQDAFEAELYSITLASIIRRSK